MESRKTVKGEFKDTKPCPSNIIMNGKNGTFKFRENSVLH